jgi:hypothetical protein
VPRKLQKLPFTHRAIFEALENRQLLSAGVLAADSDIGAPAQPGSANFSGGVYSITAGGTGIGGNSDQFNFAYNSVSGNAIIVADVTSLTNSSSAAQAGLMIRNDLSNVSAFVGLFLTPGDNLELATRTSDGGTAGQATTGGIGAPRYLELSLSGSTVSAFYSSNGTSWTSAGASQTITLTGTPLFGLAAASATSSSTTTATVSNLNISPAGWTNTDIGAPPLPGSAAYAPAINTFTQYGSGAGIGSTSDQFNFENYALTGNGAISALVSPVISANPSASSGVMIRADTTASSLFASLSLNAQNNVVFQWRNSGGAGSSAPVSVTGPVYLNLKDQANTFTAFYSIDGVNWIQVGTSVAVAMPSATTLAGLWTASGDVTDLSSSTFASVSLLRGGWTDGDIGSPALGGSAVYDSPSDTFTLNGNGSDIFGTADQFNFASTTMSGDGSVIAYVDSITNTNAWAKAGVMLRSDSTAGSAFAAVLVSPTNGITFEWRATAGGITNQEINSPAGGPVPAPVGLELTRSGNNFTAYYSTDGINWTAVGPSQSASVNPVALAGVAVTSHNTAALCTAAFSSIGVGTEIAPGAGVYSASDQLFLNGLEDAESLFFYNETNPSTGLVPDNANANGGSPSPDASIAAIGFGLSSLTIADARGWLSHSAAYQRALTTINFLYNSGANVNGFFYHFLNSSTGARYGTSEVSSVDTAELMSGVLNVAQYWAGTPLQSTALQMFDRVNWPWMVKPGGVFYGAWTPESGFSGGYGDYSEASLLYLISLGSPTHPSSLASWDAWSRTPKENYDGYQFVTADDAALFTVQYPMAWFDLRGLTDSYGLSYYQNAQTATLAQRQWMINLSGTYPDYGPNLWGLTPSEGPSGYTVWGGPPANGPIDGTVVPTAPGGSLEFEPRLTANVLENMQQTYGATVYKKYGLVDAFNPLTHWTSSLVLGIDVGMTLIAAENSRSNLVWNTFSQSPIAQQAVAEAFTGTNPTLSSAVSNKTAAGTTYGLPINLSSPLSIEPRLGGPTQLILTLGAPAVAGQNFNVSLSSYSGGSDGVVIDSYFTGNTLVIDTASTINTQTLVVNVSDVSKYTNSPSSNFTLYLGVLLGDVKGVRAVNGTDFAAFAAVFGQSTNSTNFLNDLNSDGVINGTDFAILASVFGTSLASGPAVVGAAVRPTVAAPVAAPSIEVATNTSSIEPAAVLTDQNNSATAPLLSPENVTGYKPRHSHQHPRR